MPALKDDIIFLRMKAHQLELDRLLSLKTIGREEASRIAFDIVKGKNIRQIRMIIKQSEGGSK